MAEVNVQEILNSFQKIGVFPRSEPLCQELGSEHFSSDVQKYLSIMSDNVSFNVTHSGTSLTHLMSQKEIANEYKCEENLPIIRNNCLIIGYGANGDYLCLDLESRLVVYVFHDILWEDPDEDFSEMCIRTDLALHELLQMAVNSRNYPYDAHTAEEYMNR